MKKISILFSLMAIVLGMTSCSQEDEPKYHAPTPGSFTINAPALANQYLETGTDLTNQTTFDIFCGSQPDYGFAAAGLNYSALVSLDPNVPDVDANVEGQTPKSVLIPSMSGSTAKMTFSTYYLGAAVCQLLGIADADAFAQNADVAAPVKVYFRGVCELGAMDDSRILSSNVVSYNRVFVPEFTELKPAWIYVCGDIATLDGFEMKGGEGFQTPSAANLEEYMKFAIYEQEIGSKVYIGSFQLMPKKKNPDPANPNVGVVDEASQFRFFTQLLGWSKDVSIGSNENDFYCMPINDQLANGGIFKGDGVWQGLGNWGLHVGVLTPITVVVNAADTSKIKVWYKEGIWDVQMTGGEPTFLAPAN